MVATSLFVGAAACVLERARPGTSLPTVERWTPRALAFAAIELFTVFAIVLVWLVFADWSGISKLASEQLWVQVGINWLLSTFVFYWWHRIRHDSDLLWCWTHQLHHSPQRIETLTTFYKHPFEVIADTLLNLILSFAILGISFEAFLLHAGCVACSQFFVHMNVATPHWIGFFLQRPEMHRIHHESGAHRNNYSDLPLWDILFGTFENPHWRAVKCGFTTGNERRVLDMLLLRDVHHNS